MMLISRHGHAGYCLYDDIITGLRERRGSSLSQHQYASPIIITPITRHAPRRPTRHMRLAAMPVNTEALAPKTLKRLQK